MKNQSSPGKAGGPRENEFPVTPVMDDLHYLIDFVRRVETEAEELSPDQRTLLIVLAIQARWPRHKARQTLIAEWPHGTCWRCVRGPN